LVPIGLEQYSETLSTLLLNVAAAAAAAAMQVWYRYVMQLGLVPLNGTTSKQHMAQDLGVQGWAQPLTAQEMRDIGRVIGEDS
jgi:diketogulonate reductase-like aldo/keto reductase